MVGRERRKKKELARLTLSDQHSSEQSTSCSKRQSAHAAHPPAGSSTTHHPSAALHSETERDETRESGLLVRRVDFPRSSARSKTWTAQTHHHPLLLILRSVLLLLLVVLLLLDLLLLLLLCRMRGDRRGDLVHDAASAALGLLGCLLLVRGLATGRDT